MRRLFILFVFIISLLAVFLVIKGQKGTPLYFQTEKDISDGGPFELSNGTSRYALTEVIVEDGTFFLNDTLAKFASPDIVEYRGKFLSIFTPGVSFVGVPFYLLGEHFGMPQVFAYFSVTIFLILNLFLVARLAYKLGASFYASITCGLVFAFATNALAYSLNYTQHTLSTTVILLGILNAIGKRTFLNNVLFGFLAGIGALLDVPNLILFLPAGIYILSKHFDFKGSIDKFGIFVSIKIIGLLIGFMPLIAVFGWYNQKTTGSYFKLAQIIGRSGYFKDSLPARNMLESAASELKSKDNPAFNLPFNTRAQLTGFYILLLSNERSWLFYSPILLVGIYGFWLVYKKLEKQAILTVVIGTLALNIVVYSMFGDPWGGWAFGPRYLIPGAALMASALGVAMDRFRKHLIFLSVFIVLLVYSTVISLVGALTSSAIPPKIEAVYLNLSIPHTFIYNFQLLSKNFSSSLTYNLFFADRFSAGFYLAILVVLIAVMFMAAYFALLINDGKAGKGLINFFSKNKIND